jgi:hypothetical protein
MNRIEAIVKNIIERSDIVSSGMIDYLTESVAALNKIGELFDKYGISYAFIGAVAVIEHGYVRMTEDIDILVAKEDKEKLQEIPIGFMRRLTDKSFRLYDPTAKVEIIYSGEISGDGVHGIKFPHPNDISVDKNGLKFISLPKLIEFKLSSGIYSKRYRDFGDVQGLILNNDLTAGFGDSFRDDLMQKYRELWTETMEHKGEQRQWE